MYSKQRSAEKRAVTSITHAYCWHGKNGEVLHKKVWCFNLSMQCAKISHQIFIDFYKASHLLSAFAENLLTSLTNFEKVYECK